MQAKKTFWKCFRGILLIPFLTATLSGLVLWVSRVSSESSDASIDNDTYLYLPTILLLPCGYVDEKEPNNTFSEATGPIPPGVTYRGCFPEQDDIDDVYYFELFTPSKIEVWLQNIAPGHDYDLVLYDANGKQEPDGLSNNPGNQDEHILTSEIKAEQRYFIQVHNFSRTASTQPYHLLVNYDQPSLDCNHLAITEDVFPQLKDEPDAYPIYGPIDDPNFQCRAVFDPVYDGQLAIRIEYHNAGDNFGYWGINLAPTGYDVTGYSQICLQAHAKKPLQVFRLKLKDLDGTEIAKNIIVQGEGGNKTEAAWEEECVPLSYYYDQGVDIVRLENVNVGFDKDTGDAIVWLDAFIFK